MCAAISFELMLCRLQSSLCEVYMSQHVGLISMYVFLFVIGH